jgi:hypothetical protein
VLSGRVFGREEEKVAAGWREEAVLGFSRELVVAVIREEEGSQAMEVPGTWRPGCEAIARYGEALRRGKRRRRSSLTA